MVTIPLPLADTMSRVLPPGSSIQGHAEGLQVAAKKQLGTPWFGLQTLEQIESEGRDLARKGAKATGLAETRPPFTSFVQTANHARLAHEVTEWYRDHWEGGPEAWQIRRLDEIRECLMIVRRSMLIQTLSAMEYGARVATAGYAEFAVRRARGKPLYWANFMNVAAQSSHISEADRNGWEGVIRLRNSVVHNNAIADFTRDYVLPDVLTMHFVDGEMFEGRANALSEMTWWCMHAYARWCNAFLEWPSARLQATSSQAD